MMAPIRLAFSDFPGPFNPTRILSLLEAHFDIEQVEDNPDYVIFSVFGYRFLSFPNAIRIFFTGENVRPDFNLCDYGFGYDWMEFGDRYYRWPNYQLYKHFKELCGRRAGAVTHRQLASQKTKFCNFVYSNPDAIPYRDQLFHAIGRYRGVDSAGRHLNNLGYSPGQAYRGDWPGECVEFQRQYKFSIVCENSSTPGYTTEKIVHALAADTIPIYFGNPLIAREFNPRRLINCHDFQSLDEVVARVAEVDRDEECYLRIVNEPFFASQEPPTSLSDAAIAARFKHIFDQPKASAFRRTMHDWGLTYETRRRREVAAAAALSEVCVKVWRAAKLPPEQIAQQLEPLKHQLSKLVDE